jgi:NTP pyrophosphatase (non-canonical NTP hydrolase)
MTTNNAELVRRQLEQHGVDRYPTVHAQYIKLVTEVGELGDELLQPERDVDLLRAEAADVMVCLYHLAAKLGFDLDDALFELVQRDARRFTT